VLATKRSTRHEHRKHGPQLSVAWWKSRANHRKPGSSRQRATALCRGPWPGIHRQLRTAISPKEPLRTELTRPAEPMGGLAIVSAGRRPPGQCCSHGPGSTQSPRATSRMRAAPWPPDGRRRSWCLTATRPADQVVRFEAVRLFVVRDTQHSSPNRMTTRNWPPDLRRSDARATAAWRGPNWPAIWWRPPTTSYEWSDWFLLLPRHERPDPVSTPRAASLPHPTHPPPVQPTSSARAYCLLLANTAIFPGPARR